MLKNKNNELFLSVVVPSYNEEKTIYEIIRRISSVKFNFTHEIIIVDDGSQDKTEEIVKNRILKEFKNVKYIRLQKNFGKGNAVKTGISEAKGEFIIIQDADLEYYPEDILKMISFAKKNKANVVYGNRFALNDNNWTYPSHFIGNKLITSMLNILYGTKLSDVEVCYKLFKRTLIDPNDMKANDFRIELELTRLLSKKSKIYEIPIRYNPRTKDEGKKIDINDGFKAFCWLLTHPKK